MVAFLFTSTVVAVNVVIVEDGAVEVESPADPRVGSGFNVGGGLEGSSSNGPQRSVQLSVAAVDGGGGNSESPIFSLCAFLPLLNLDLSLSRKTFML